MHVAMLKSSAANEQMSKKRVKDAGSMAFMLMNLETAIRLLLMLLVAYSK